jgi:hypothetical protein
MDMSWIVKYAGCTAGEACMGPPAGWWVFGVELRMYPYMLIFALLFSPLISFAVHTIGQIGKKKGTEWVFKDNYKNVLMIFLALMVIEIAAMNFFVSSGVY